MRLLLRGVTWFTSGKLVQGHYCQALSSLLERKYGCRNVYLTGSGRLAIYIFLKALQRKGVFSKNVLMPFYICPSVPDTVIRAGMFPVFVPVKKDLTLCADQLSPEAVAASGVAIIPHVYGYGAEVKRIINELRRINPEIVIMDDAASAYGVMHEGKYLGAFGDAGILSFSQGKLLNATGGGSLLLYDEQLQPFVDKEYATLPMMEPLRKFLDLLQVIWRFGMHKYSDPINYLLGRFGVATGSICGNDSRMTNYDAMLATKGENEREHIWHKRCVIIDYYYKRLGGLEGLFFAQDTNESSVPVSRLYFGLKGQKVNLNQNCQVSNNNPLYCYLRERGVKVFYPYLPVKRFMPHYGEIWKRESWIFSLLGLPVDFRKDLAWHNQVIEAILDYGRTGYGNGAN